MLDGWWSLAKSIGTIEESITEVPLEIWDITALKHARSQREAMHIALRGLARKRRDGKELPPGVRTFDTFPEVIRLTHLADYVPYEKKGTKTVERAEDVEYWSRVLNRPVSPGEKVHYEKGQMRGAAWMRVRRTAEDVQRLEKLLRGVVGWVRMGKFVESVGEKCTRCPYKSTCLTSGYELRGDDARDLNAALKDIDLGALGELSTND